MAKRGEPRPWKVIYRWPNGVGGTTPYVTRGQAEHAAESQRAMVNPSTGEADCTVTVEYRPAK